MADIQINQYIDDEYDILYPEVDAEYIEYENNRLIYGALNATNVKAALEELYDRLV